MLAGVLYGFSILYSRLCLPERISISASPSLLFFPPSDNSSLRIPASLYESTEKSDDFAWFLPAFKVPGRDIKFLGLPAERVRGRNKISRDSRRFRENYYVTNRFAVDRSRAVESSRASRAGSTFGEELIPLSIKQNHPITGAAPQHRLRRGRFRNQKTGTQQRAENVC